MTNIDTVGLEFIKTGAVPLHIQRERRERENDLYYAIATQVIETDVYIQDHVTCAVTLDIHA